MCSYCHKGFKHKTNLIKHIKKCIYKKSPIIVKKPSSIKQSEPEPEPEPEPENKDIKALISVVKGLSEDIGQMKHQISQQQPHITIHDNRVSNVSNVNTVNNFVIKERIPDDFYKALRDKVGYSGTLKIMDDLSKADKIDAVSIYKQLYPSNKIADNPVVYHNDTFKYLDDNDQIVSDNSIIHILAKKIQTALLHASNNLITESIKTKNTSQLYDVYDLRDIQGNISNIEVIKQQLADYIKLNLTI